MKDIQRSPHSPELLETRIAPAIVFGVNGDNELFRFDSASPGTIIGSATITGLESGETVLGIDFRPIDLQLYAVGSSGALYRLDPFTAKATPVATLIASPADATDPFTALSGSHYGIDFNPVPDRLRLVSDLDQNLRINPNNGEVTTDGTLNPGDPRVVASAYTNNFFGTTTTTLYGIDSTLDALVIQNPPNDGTLATVGVGLGINFTDIAAFDIQTRSSGNTAYAALATDGASSGLYTVNLTTGVATLVGSIGAPGTFVHGLAVAPEGFAVSINGNVATFVGGPLDDTLVIDSAGGLLRHNRFTAGDPGYNSEFDFNPSAAGDQTLADAADASGLLIDGGLGADTIQILATQTVAIVNVTLPGDEITGAKGTLKKNLLTYPDADGDTVKINISKGKVGVTNFLFDSGNQGIAGLQLQTITLAATPAEFSGAKITVTAKRSALGGDNSAAVGYIDADGIDLASVNIAGDLGRIDVGNLADPKPALKSLTARSMGAYGNFTQGAFPSLESSIEGSLGSLTVKGSIHQAFINVFGNADVKIGKVSLSGSLLGGDTPYAGSIQSSGSIGAINILGSVIGGSANNTGLIVAAGNLGPVKIRGSLHGGNGFSSGSLVTILGSIASVSIGADLVGSSFTNGIFSSEKLGPVTIGGSAYTTGPNPVIILAEGILAAPTLTAAQAVAIKSINIKGSADNVSVLAGYAIAQNPTNADAQIGSVTIGGNWSGGSIVAGATSGGNGFGNSLDAAIAGGDPAISSRIASIGIKGQALGTVDPGDHYGFVAQQIGSVKIGGAAIPLVAGPSNDTTGVPIGITGDLRIREV